MLPRGTEIMSRTLELPDELYERLEKAAAEGHTTPVDWLEHHVPKPNGQSTAPADKKTLRERLRGLIGNFSSGGQERLSEDCGEKFADYLEQKRREGRF
jgi:hypothetical protein